MGTLDFLNKKAAQKPTGKVIRHIVCLCYDAPYINSLKAQIQDFIIKAEQERGSIIAPTSRITFDSFYNNSDLEKPDMIRQKLEQVYASVYRQNAMYELDVPSGGYGEVHVKTNVFQPKLTVWR